MIQLDINYKNVTVYIDKNNDMYFVPHEIWTTHDVTAEINDILDLKYPYTLEELKFAIKESFGR